MPNYTRFWDLHICHDNNNYDFAGSIDRQQQYQDDTHHLTGRSFIAIHNSAVSSTAATIRLSNDASQNPAAPSGDVPRNANHQPPKSPIPQKVQTCTSMGTNVIL